MRPVSSRRSMRPESFRRSVRPESFRPSVRPESRYENSDDGKTIRGALAAYLVSYLVGLELEGVNF